MNNRLRLARFNSPPVFKNSLESCLTKWGIESIIRKSSFIHEGKIVSENGKRTYFGSMMITIELDGKNNGYDSKKYECILRHIKLNPILNTYFSRIARLEATRKIADPITGPAYMTFEAKLVKNRIEITIDIEMPCPGNVAMQNILR